MKPALLPLILDSVPQPVWVVDTEGLILYTNPAAVAVLGYEDGAELDGRPSHETLHPSYPDGSLYPASECAMLTPTTTGQAAQGDDEWFMRRDGSFFPASWWAAPIDLPEGRGVVYSFFDVTERRAHEQAARERDAAEIRAAESRAAQRRIVESVAAVHRQTARDLHDGAQQRLVNLMIGLRLAREYLPDAPPGALALLDQSVEDAQAAIDELRHLAAGIHPSVLTMRGLWAAIAVLAESCPVPVVVTGACERRLPAAIEANAYYLVAEALTNAVKHAQATRIDIVISLGAELELIVADDGVGGVPQIGDDGVGGVPQIAAGSGLVGLHDRVAAFDGTLTIESPPGSDTRVIARIPALP